MILWKLRICALTLLFFSIYKLQYRNYNSYFNLLLLLSGGISLHPGLPHINQLQPQSEWSVFNSKGLHFIHLNVKSLLPKIDKLRNIAKLSNVAVIGISVSKLDDSVLSSEIHIDNLWGRGSLLHKERFKF